MLTVQILREALERERQSASKRKCGQSYIYLTRREYESLPPELKINCQIVVFI